MSQPTALSFEVGYTRLQAIAARVNSDEVPVHEMCELFAEGKGLEQALTAYLEQQKSRVEEIERGEGVQRFNITAPTTSATVGIPRQPATAGSEDVFASQSAPQTGVADDDIPF